MPDESRAAWIIWGGRNSIKHPVEQPSPPQSNKVTKPHKRKTLWTFVSPSLAARFFSPHITPPVSSARWIQPVAPGYDRLSMLSLPLPRFRSRTALLFVSGLSAYVLMAVFARYHSYFSFDLRIARAIQSVELPGIAPLMIFVSALGSGWIEFTLVVATTAALIVAGLRTGGLICIAGIGLGKFVSSSLK